MCTVMHLLSSKYIHNVSKERKRLTLVVKENLFRTKRILFLRALFSVGIGHKSKCTFFICRPPILFIALKCSNPKFYFEVLKTAF